ncbi:MAG: hypothetical protein FGM37_00320 [Phycisphaerales bacterium]|nr:hypothetical protein [Phycisphaerales bacterium]
MSLASARVKMQESLREMRLSWADVRRDWSDSAAAEIERQRIEPLEDRIRAALLAIERMEHFAHMVRRETGDP